MCTLSERWWLAGGVVAGAGIVAGLAAWRERRVHRKRRRKELCELDTLKPSTLVAAGALPAGEPGCTVAPPTSRDVLGPFYVVGAPFRAKLSPPASGGDTIFVSGRVLCAKTGDPLPFTLIDMWQMDPTTDTYDFHWESPESMKQEDRVYHPRQDPNIVLGVTGARSRNFAYRTRLLTDHQGRFEVETERPQPYFDPDDVCEHTGTDKECLCAWRCPHIHVMVQPSTEHRQLISQLYFEGGKYNDTDKHFSTATVISLTKKRRGEASWSEGTFNLVVEPL